MCLIHPQGSGKPTGRTLVGTARPGLGPAFTSLPGGLRCGARLSAARLARGSAALPLPGPGPARCPAAPSAEGGTGGGTGEPRRRLSRPCRERERVRAQREQRSVPAAASPPCLGASRAPGEGSPRHRRAGNGGGRAGQPGGAAASRGCGDWAGGPARQRRYQRACGGFGFCWPWIPGASPEHPRSSPRRARTPPSLPGVFWVCPVPGPVRAVSWKERVRCPVANTAQ